MFKWIFLSFIFTPCCKYTLVKTMQILAVNFFAIASRIFEVEQDRMPFQNIVLLLNYFCRVS